MACNGSKSFFAITSIRRDSVRYARATAAASEGSFNHSNIKRIFAGRSASESGSSKPHLRCSDSPVGGTLRARSARRRHYGTDAEQTPAVRAVLVLVRCRRDGMVEAMISAAAPVAHVFQFLNEVLARCESGKEGIRFQNIG